MEILWREGSTSFVLSRCAWENSKCLLCIHIVCVLFICLCNVYLFICLCNVYVFICLCNVYVFICLCNVYVFICLCNVYVFICLCKVYVFVCVYMVLVCRSIRKWWAEYLESMGDFDMALQFYEAAKDYLSMVRILCFSDNLQRAMRVAEESGCKAAAYHLARKLGIGNKQVRVII